MSVRRADRLEATLHLLRAADAVTVREIAAALGVTPRTVHRDLAVLRDRGLPIASSTGPAGGVRLDGRTGVTAVTLTLGEAVALWLTTRLAVEASLLPWGRTAQSALTKLLASLPRSRARALRSMLGRVVIGPPPSTDVRRSASTTAHDVLPALEAAMTESCALTFAYRDAGGRRTTRRVEPHGLLLQPPVWYVLAFDLERGAARTFRMDRMRELRVTRAHRFVADAQVLRDQLGDVHGWSTLAPGLLR